MAGERLYLRGGENKRVHCVAKRKAATAKKGLRKQVSVRSRLVAMPSRPPDPEAGELRGLGPCDRRVADHPPAPGKTRNGPR